MDLGTRAAVLVRFVRQRHLFEGLDDTLDQGAGRVPVAGLHRRDDRIDETAAADIFAQPAQLVEQRAALAARVVTRGKSTPISRGQLPLLEDLLRLLAQW